MITSDLAKISHNQGSSYGDSSVVNRGVDDVTSVGSSILSSNCNEESGTSHSISSAAQKTYIPLNVPDVSKPTINQCFQSLDQGFIFYKEYGRLGGFDVRKGTEKRDESGIVSIKHYTCSKEGCNDFRSTLDSNLSKVKRRRTASTRCCCKAKIVLKLNKDREYFVFKFDEVHNHPLVDESGRQFLRSSRQMTISSRNFVFDAAKVNIGCSKAYGLMKEMVGGYSNVGATVRDFRNFNRDLKCYIGEGDGQMLIEKFKVLQEGSSSFYYAYELDETGHLTKLFWADAICRRNFEVYGDAVSFDATFDTNKYNMIFAPFTGDDKHEKCVSFAACLLAKEDVTHYKWVFDQFSTCMKRHPVVIITDQCPAMKIAVSSSLSSENGFVATKHRLCMWHIMHKFPIKLGNRLCKETDFMEKMKKYIWSNHLDIAEFEQGWQAVMKEFNLENNKWLSDMYAIRSSWIPAFFRDEPMLGLMRTTSRSESENLFFAQFHKQADSLCEFWLRFQSAMQRQRNETERLDEESKSSFPNTLSTWFIEDEAADLFTRTVFYKVQEEILAACLDMQIKRMSEEVEGITNFEIKDVKVKEKIFKVSVSKEHAVCSCKKFVMCGIVCRHSFCGMKHIGVTRFPKSLILNRWSKIADCGSSCDMISADYFKMEKVSLKLMNIWFDFRQVLNKAGVQMEVLEFVHQTVKDLSTKVGNSLDGASFSKKDHMAALIGEQPQGELTVLVPNISKNKGNYFKSGRLISEREKAITKANKRIRRCKECLATTHDSRTCPKKKKLQK
nr:PREDICTED: protein FAR1-RELATED SEQUENCE 5-like [Daucus carota subsp. sativus]